MKTGLMIIAVLLILCSAAYVVISEPPSERGYFVSPAYASPAVTAMQSIIGGMSVGDVLVDEQVVFRIRTTAGGLSPFQRAQIVADRLEQLMGDTLEPEDITTGIVNGQEVVLADGEVIITADPAHAKLNGTTPTALSNLWAQRLENVVAGRPVDEPPTNTTSVSEKVVPIISVGSGLRIGGALVSGSSDKMDEVKAVAQIEGNFGRSVRIRALVPVSTENVVQQISRVPQTSVIGLVDIKL